MRNEGLKHLWLPFTQMGDPLGATPHIVRGEGCWLIDEQGKRYLDGIASWWVNLHGHDHPRLIAALKRQAEVLPHCSLGSMTHDPALRLAAGLGRIAPESLTRVFFSDDGSTAVETALKISLQFFQQSGQEQRTRFVTLQRAYHGDTLGAVSVGGIESYHGKFRPLCFEALFAEAPDCARCDEGDGGLHLPGGPEPSCSLKCLNSLENILQTHGADCCGLIVEPLVQGAVGMRMYRAAALARMRELCHAHGIHLIADCVAVAFGRTGKMFACEHAGIAPDLMAVAKGLTGGYLPLAATLATEAIYEGFLGSYESNRQLAHGHSFTGNPLAAACAAENLELLREEAVIDSLAPKIARLRASWWAELGDLPHVGELRQTGLIAALDLFQDAEARTPYPASDQIARRVALGCIERGLFLRPLGDALYLLPPLAISDDELELAVATLREAIVEVTG